MPGRSFSSSNYRFGFNGKLKDDEIKGNGNSIDFGARIYDSRLGRWLSLDPLQVDYPYFSPFQFCADNPVINVDPDGKKIKPANESSKEAIDAHLTELFGKRAFQEIFSWSLPTEYGGAIASDRTRVPVYTTKGRWGDMKRSELNHSLKNYGLNRSQRREAKSWIKIAASPDVVEIAVVSNTSTFANSKLDQCEGDGKVSSIEISSPLIQRLSKRIESIDNSKTPEKSGEFSQYSEKQLTELKQEKQKLINDYVNKEGYEIFPEGPANKNNQAVIIDNNNQSILSKKFEKASSEAADKVQKESP